MNTASTLIKRWLSGVCLLGALGLASCGGDASSPVPISSDGSSGTGSSGSTGGSGSDDSDSSTANVAPLANAGSDFTGVAGATVVLSGEARDSDGEIVSQVWKQLTGSDATIASSTSLLTSLVLPDISSSETLTFSLTVTDDDGATDVDTVSVTVLVDSGTDSDSDSSSTSGLIVNAGDDQVVVAGETVTLSASAYSATATSYVYRWVQTSGSEVELSASTGREVTFTAPLTSDSDNSEGLRFQLTVIDSNGNSKTDTTLVTIFNELDTPTGLAVAATDTAITLTWTAVTGAESYDVYYANESFASLADGDLDIDDLANYATLDGGTLKAYLESTTTFTLTDFEASTKYYFIVVARRGTYVSDPSDEVDETSSANPDDGTDGGSGDGSGDGSGTTGEVTGDLNDTGQTTCYGNTSSTSACSETSVRPGQDGYYGRDRKATLGTLTKTGGGAAGFDFTKISSTGAELDADTDEPACIRDNVTGLMWEGKGNVTGSTLIDEVRSDYQYAWYYDDETVSGGIVGNEKFKGGSFICSITYCNISLHVETLNENKWCGRSNWRVPWLQELAGIIHYGASSTPLVDQDYFQNVSGKYWTLTIQVLLSYMGTTGASAWVVDFDTGLLETRTKNMPAGIIAVSGD